MKTHFEAADTRFRYDETHHIFEFTWKGTISEKSVIEMLTVASKIAEGMNVVHWLSDRSQLEGYEGEARLWMKNEFVKEVGKDMLPKIDKIAVISSTNPMAQLASGILAGAMKAKNPNIIDKEFDYSGAALNWLKGTEAKTEEPKKRGFFSRG